MILNQLFASIKWTYFPLTSYYNEIPDIYMTRYFLTPSSNKLITT